MSLLTFSLKKTSFFYVISLQNDNTNFSVLKSITHFHEDGSWTFVSILSFRDCSVPLGRSNFFKLCTNFDRSWALLQPQIPVDRNSFVNFSKRITRAKTYHCYTNACAWKHSYRWMSIHVNLYYFPFPFFLIKMGLQ